MGQFKSRIRVVDAPSSLDVGRLISVLEEIISRKNRKLKRLFYHFVSREMIREINVNHLNHNYETDVITFDYCSFNKIEGDIYVCLDVIEDNAKRFQEEASRELYRVLFHGLLHLLKYNDTTDEERVIMRQEEDKCLKMIYQLDGKI